MVSAFDKSVDARDRHGTRRVHDQLHPPSKHRARQGCLVASLIWLACTALAEPVRVATYNTELSRNGPGLLLRDIRSGKDDQVLAVIDVIDHIKPDVIALQDIDWDHGLNAINALNDKLSVPYAYILSLRPNSGVMTDLDLDGNGMLRGGGDAQGFGTFAGQGGMALLSRFRILTEEVTDLSDMLWRDMPGARLPVHKDGSPFPSAAAVEIQRLSSTGHWVVPIAVGDNTLTILTYKATPPVFDGPEDQNGLRNADEAKLWVSLLSGNLGAPAPKQPFVLMGTTNLDPHDGDGIRYTFTDLVQNTPLFDPIPSSAGGALAAKQGGVNDNQKGNPAYDTADWRDVDGPGNLRIDYVLPSQDLKITKGGVFWPPSDDGFLPTVETASRHRLVWADLDL